MINDNKFLKMSDERLINVYKIHRDRINKQRQIQRNQLIEYRDSFEINGLSYLLNLKEQNKLEELEKQIGGFKGKTIEEKFNNKLKELNNIIDSRTTEKLDEFIVQNYPQNKELIENYKLIRDEMKKRKIQK